MDHCIFSPSMYLDTKPSLSLKDEEISSYKAELIRKKKERLEMADLFNEPDYREWIEKAYLETEKTLNWLVQNSSTQAEISRCFDQALEDFSNRCGEYYQGSRENLYSMQKTAEKLSRVDRVIANIEASSVPALPTEVYLKKLEANPFYGILRMQQEERAAVGQLGVIGAEVTIGAVKAVCNLTPGTKELCKATLNFAKKTIDVAGDVGMAALDAVGLKEPLEKAHAANEKTLKMRNSYLYGIPEETTAQQIENSKCIPIGLLVPGVAAGTAMAFWKRVSATKVIAEVALEIPAANRNVFNVQLPHLGHNLFTPAISRQIERAAIDYSCSLHHPYSNFHMLYESEQVLQAIPRVAFVKNREKTWLTALFSKYPTGIGEAKVSYLKEVTQYLTESVAKVEYLGTRTVIKESEYAPKIIGEIHGLFRLRELKLKSLDIPTPIMAGRYTYPTGDLFFVAKSHIDGVPFDSLLQRIGSCHKEKMGFERIQRLNGFDIASFAAGQGIGELQLRTVSAGTLPESFLLGSVASFEQTLGRVSDLLGSINMRGWQFDRKSSEVRQVIKGFSENPGPLALGAGDINLSQFIWNRQAKGPQVGLIDMEFVPSTFGIQKQPIVPVSKEFYDFVYAIEGQGIAHGLTLHEVSIFRHSFARGYYSIYKGPSPSTEAIRFYQLDNHLRTIEYLAHGIKEGRKVDPLELQNMIEKAKTLFNQ